MNENITIIKGNEFTLGITATADGQPIDFTGEGHTAQLVVHAATGDKIFNATQYNGADAFFYLTSDDVDEIINNSLKDTVTYCINIIWNNGSVSTALYGYHFDIVRC